MESTLIAAFERMLVKNTKMYNMEIIRHKIYDKVVTIYSSENDYHLLYTLRSPVISDPLKLQWQVNVEADRVRVLTFADPILFENLCYGAISIANAINRSTRSQGRFVVHETGDFAYDMTFTEEMLAKMSEHVERELFVNQIDFWATLHVPLVMYSKGEWEAKTACDYVTTLLEQGYIDNSLWGL